VERHIKSMLSYYFSEKYGENQSAYLDENNYNLTQRNQHEIQKLIQSLKKSISLPTRYTYIYHHIKKYRNVPLWVAMNALIFPERIS
jgi:abortive infection bacteriophage resistance protein